MRTRLLLTMFFVLITVGALAGTRTKEEMKEAAKNLDFERAMELRDALFELKSEL